MARPRGASSPTPPGKPVLKEALLPLPPPPMTTPPLAPLAELAWASPSVTAEPENCGVSRGVAAVSARE
jgi:hypothetical protein